MTLATNFLTLLLNKTFRAQENKIVTNQLAKFAQSSSATDKLDIKLQSLTVFSDRSHDFILQLWIIFIFICS